MDRRPGPSRVICSTRQPGIGQSLFMLRSMGSDASPFKHQRRPAQSTQMAGEPHPRGEAQPFIEAATRTSVVLVDPNTGSDGKGEPGADIAPHLDRHGSPTEVVTVGSDGRAVSEVILDQARRMSADLIVMGAYGHSRAREWVLGGATLDMLEQSDFTILMAH